MHKLWTHPNGRYYVLHGPRLKSRISLRTSDREEAEIRFAQFIAASANLLPDSPLVGDILDGYQSSRIEHGRNTGEPLRSPDSLRHCVTPLKEHLGCLRPEHLVPPEISKYARVRGAADGTVLRDIGVLRAAMDWALQNRIITNDQLPIISNPVPTPLPRDRWMTRVEANALLRVCFAPHLRLFVTLGLISGARTAALLELKWSRVDFERGIVDLGEGHGNKRRAIVPFNHTLRKALEAARINACTGYVIEYAGKPLKYIKRGFELACERAGIEGVTPHILRHTCATWLVMAGISYEEIGKRLGDTAEVIENTYGHHHPDFLKPGSDALELDEAA